MSARLRRTRTAHCRPQRTAGGVAIALAALLSLTAGGAAPQEAGDPGSRPTFREVELPGKRLLRFAVLLPEGFRTDRPYPVILALPPGSQTLALVEAGMVYWEEAPARGWVVISPAAPGGRLFFEGSEALIPAFLDEILAKMTVEGGCFHVAGASNGGRAAFRVALEDPDRFCSLTAFPGHPPDERDMKALERLRGIPLTLLVGEDDEGFLREARRTKKALRRLGLPVHLQVFKGEGHNIGALRGGSKLLDILEPLRVRTPPVTEGSGGTEGRPHTGPAPGDADRPGGGLPLRHEAPRE